MSKVWFVLACIIATVNALDETCDSCIRANNKWCPGKGCIIPSLVGDGGVCDIPIASLKNITLEPPTPGDQVHPKSAQNLLPTYALYDTKLNVIYYKSDVQKKVDFFFDKAKVIVSDSYIDEAVNSTHRRLVTAAKTKAGFCDDTSFTDVVVQVRDLGNSTQTILAQCSCECSSQVITNATVCHHHGNFSCGFCYCENDWTGENCEKESCLWRGDVEAPMLCDNAPLYTGEAKACNGNGLCTCNTCKCSTSIEGSQYLSSDYPYNCIDVCTATMPCDKCLLNGSLGYCDKCHHSMTEDFMRDFRLRILELDEDSVYDKVQNRSVWVHCKKVQENCEFDYYAMKEDNSQTYVAMVTNNTRCTSPDANAAGPLGKPVAGSIVPLVLGILLALVAVAVIGGFMLWKHMHPLPAPPTSTSQYANIEAEDCTGENPLYKQPISSFKNPTYGKW